MSALKDHVDPAAVRRISDAFGGLPTFESAAVDGLEALERLRHDPARYVRLSVANHLGDVAKDHLDLANRTARRWWDEGAPNLRWIVRHGMRGPIKAGDPETLDILGFGPPKVDVRRFERSATEVRYPGELSR